MTMRTNTTARTPYKDPVTARRHRLMMHARIPLTLPFIGYTWWGWPVWIPVATFVAWYAVWLVWAAGVLEDR